MLTKDLPDRRLAPRPRVHSNALIRVLPLPWQSIRVLRATNLPPDARTKAAGHRVRMALAATALSRRHDPGCRATGRAMRAALRRPDPAVREWIRRVEKRRGEVAGLRGVRTPDEMGVYDIALAVQWMSVPPILGRLLLEVVRELRPASCLEIGTGLGISGAYVGAGLELVSNGRLVSVDIDPRPAAIATEGFVSLGLERVRTVAGPPDTTLPAALDSCQEIDFAFIDADHRASSTIETLTTVEPRLSADAVVVLDDVSSAWGGMEDAWAAILTRPRIRSGIRLGRFGFLFCGDHHARIQAARS